MNLQILSDLHLESHGGAELEFIHALDPEGVNTPVSPPTMAGVPLSSGNSTADRRPMRLRSLLLEALAGLAAVLIFLLIRCLEQSAFW
jgi:hypothetical protein